MYQRCGERDQDDFVGTEEWEDKDELTTDNMEELDFDKIQDPQHPLDEADLDLEHALDKIEDDELSEAIMNDEFDIFGGWVEDSDSE